jgi:hypothetical protein
MYLNVKQRGDQVATFRWIEIRLMEMLAAWVPTTPEMEIKLLFGTHIWETAQQADALGKRTLELRLPVNDSLAPSDAYVAHLNEIAAISDSKKRIAAFYDCMLPALDQRLRDYALRVDNMLDGPTMRLIDRFLWENGRMVQASVKLREEMPQFRLEGERAWLASLRQRDASLYEIVQYRADKPATAAA